MSIDGQGHFFTIYFTGFVCFVLYLDNISGERLQDHWSSGLFVVFCMFFALFCGFAVFYINFCAVLPYVCADNIKLGLGS